MRLPHVFTRPLACLCLLASLIPATPGRAEIAQLDVSAFDGPNAGLSPGGRLDVNPWGPDGAPLILTNEDTGDGLMGFSGTTYHGVYFDLSW